MNTCPFTWETQGVFRKRADNVKVSAVAVEKEKRLICASYENGDVRLYRYPCQLEHAAAFQTIPGIATEATRVRFSADAQYLLILDSRTRSVLQYQIRYPARELQPFDPIPITT